MTDPLRTNRPSWLKSAQPVWLGRPAEEPDPRCPDCRGKCVDKHGFDCVRCAGEGVVDE